jgi:hypothetical protein
VKRTESNTKRELEFDLRETDRLPNELGVHCLYHIQAGRGVIAHSPECPAADLAAAKAQLENMWRVLAPETGNLAAADTE